MASNEEKQLVLDQWLTCLLLLLVIPLARVLSRFCEGRELVASERGAADAPSLLPLLR
jgi:hypothetical protein